MSDEGRFAPDLSGVKAGMPIYERGEYEVVISDVKPIYYNRESDGKTIAGAQVNLEMAGRVENDGTVNPNFGPDGDSVAGEPVAPNRLYVHSQKALGLVKQFIMFSLGYAIDEEDAFNADIGGDLDISVFKPVDAEEATLGSGWDRLVGKRLRVTLDKRLYDGREQQDHKAFMPLPK